MFDSRRPPRRQQNSKVETADSRFGGIDGLGTDSTVWKDFAIVLVHDLLPLDSAASVGYQVLGINHEAGGEEEMQHHESHECDTHERHGDEPVHVHDPHGCDTHEHAHAH